LDAETKRTADPVDVCDGSAKIVDPMKTLSAFLCALVLTPLVASAGDFPDISHEELKKAIDSKQVVLLDVNGSTSWKQGHIPGAIDYTAVEKDLASKLPADKNALVVAYCGNEKCTAYASAAKAAKSLGYANVKHYAGGIAGWKAKEKTEPGS
jgi:rhodanese-related sulfurtransferase